MLSLKLSGDLLDCSETIVDFLKFICPVFGIGALDSMLLPQGYLYINSS